MVVYNKTNVDKDVMFNSLVKSTKKMQYSRLILSSVVLVCGIPFIILGHVANESDYLAVGYAFIAVAIIYYFVALLGMKRAPKKVELKNKDVIENGISYNYQFKEQSFNVTAIIDNKTKKLPYKYDMIKKVYEYEDRYEFVLKENEILFVNKSGFDSPKHIEFFIKNLKLNKKKIINKEK